MDTVAKKVPLYIILSHKVGSVESRLTPKLEERDILVGLALCLEFTINGEKVHFPYRYFTDILPELSVKLMKEYLLAGTIFDDGLLTNVSDEEYHEAVIKHLNS